MNTEGWLFQATRAASARSSENGYPSSAKTAGSRDNGGDEASMHAAAAAPQVAAAIGWRWCRQGKYGAAAVLALAQGKTDNTANVHSKYQGQRFYHRYLPLPGRQDRG
jgi:hypothetical protein